jgi:hypothetical protein
MLDRRPSYLVMTACQGSECSAELGAASLFARPIGPIGSTIDLPNALPQK